MWGSKIRWKGKIKTLLIQCLEHHYGSLAKCVTIPNAAELMLDEIKATLENYQLGKTA